MTTPAENKESRMPYCFKAFGSRIFSFNFSIGTYPQIPVFPQEISTNLSVYSTSKSSLGSASSSTAVSMTPSVSVGRP